MSRTSRIYSQGKKLIKREGPGWRLARDSARQTFSVLIGGEQWAVELSESEWVDFVSVVNELITQHGLVKSQLMEDESIYLGIQKSSWWGCMDGNKKDWSLKLIFHGDGANIRGFEMYWPIPVAQSFVKAMRNMWDSEID